MLKPTIWTSENEKAFGLKSNFKSEDEFVATIIAQYKDFDGKDCIVRNVKIETCISTSKGLEADTTIQMSMTDIVIENYYIAEVYEIEEGEIPLTCDSCNMPISEEKSKLNDGFCDTCHADKYEP
jgi:Zn finger protein HypA/HybF involved in hydrogenase expression